MSEQTGIRLIRLKKKLRRIFFLIFFMLISLVSISQWRLEEYYPITPFDSLRHKQLYLKIDNLNFFDNLEYQSPHIVGATYIGIHGRTYLDYYFTPTLRMQVGVSALKYSGRNDFDQVSEWFTLTYQPHEFFSFIAGNLTLGTLPGISPQIYNPQHVYLYPNTKGMMINIQHKIALSSLFINWRQFILPNDPFREQFFAGFTNSLLVADNENYQLMVPLHISGYHQGGEIDNSSEGVETLLNSRIGFEMTFKRYDKQLIFGSFLYTFNETTRQNRQNFRKGFGVNTESKFLYKNWVLSAAYWYSYRYFSPLGHPIYNSYTPDKPSQIFNYQYLLFLTTAYNHTIDKIGRVELDVQLAWDIPREKIDFFTGLKLIISEEFFLKKLK